MKTPRHHEVILLLVGFIATVAIVTYGWCDAHSGISISMRDIFLNLKSIEWLWIVIVSLTVILAFAVIVQALKPRDLRSDCYCPLLILSANSTIAVSLIIMGLSMLEERNPNIHGLSALRDPAKYLIVGMTVALPAYVISMVSIIRFRFSEK
jgi:nicotinamide riboside transporter PnuC